MKTIPLLDQIHLGPHPDVVMCILVGTVTSHIGAVASNLHGGSTMKEYFKDMDRKRKFGELFGVVFFLIALVSSMFVLDAILHGVDLTLAGLLFGATGLFFALSWFALSVVSHWNVEKQIEDGFDEILKAVKECGHGCQQDKSRE